MESVYAEEAGTTRSGSAPRRGADFLQEGRRDAVRNRWGPPRYRRQVLLGIRDQSGEWSDCSTTSVRAYLALQQDLNDIGGKFLSGCYCAATAKLAVLVAKEAYC